MDNLFEILIYLFIIISFLSSLFKKKEKPKPPEQSTDSPPEPVKSQSSETNEDYDIMKEIEKMFKMETEEGTASPPPPKPVQPSRVPDESIRDSSWTQPTKSEHVSENQWDREKKRLEDRRKHIDSSVERQAKKFEQLLSAKQSLDRLTIKNIRRKLKEPESFREFIIASEILGKPKSLRR